MRRGSVFALVVLAVACAKQKAASEAPDAAASAESADANAADGAPAFEAIAPVERLDAFEQELARMEAELQDQGIALDDDALRKNRFREEEGTRQQEKKKTETVRAARDVSPAGRCRRICDLSEATCDLQDKICALAQEHAGEMRYATVCARAEDDCERAAEACHACSE